MRAYGASGAHRKATPHLAEWADEASVGHWRRPTTLPEWPEAVRRLREERRPLTLHHPASIHGPYGGSYPVNHGCGAGRYRGPHGSCHRFGTGPYPNGYFGPSGFHRPCLSGEMFRFFYQRRNAEPQFQKGVYQDAVC